MVSKVNGIKIYPKHCLGSTLCAAFYVFAGFMIVFGLSFFPMLSSTINGTVMRATPLDLIGNFFEQTSEVKDGNLFKSLSVVTHFFNPKKYNSEVLNVINNLRDGASEVGNYAVFWYGSAYMAFDIIITVSYLLLAIFGLYMLVEGIIRLVTGTYPKFCTLFTGIAFFLLILFCVSSFVTNFCLKYIALEAMPEGETYVSNACPLQYIVWGLVFACWIAEFWVYALFIKGKLYVANARLIRGRKRAKKGANDSEQDFEDEDDFDDEIDEEEVIEENARTKEVLPIEEQAKEPVKESVKETSKKQTVPEAPKEDLTLDASKKEPSPVEIPAAELAPEVPIEKISAPIEEPKEASEDAKKSE